MENIRSKILHETDAVANLEEVLKAAAGGHELADMQRERRETLNPDREAALKEIENKGSPRAHEDEILIHAQLRVEESRRSPDER